MNKKINNFAFASLIIILIVASFLGVGIYCITKSAKNDAYISLLLGSLLGFVVIGCFIILFNYEPNLSISQKIKKLVGKKIGTIINIYLCIKLLFLGSSAFYNLLNLISSQFLSETPPFFIGLSFIIVIVWANIKGIKTIANVSSIILIINIFLLTSVLIPLIPEVDFSNVLPFMENGINPVLKGSLYYLTINILPIFILLIIPKNKIRLRDEKKGIILPYLISILITFLIIFFTLTIMGIYATLAYQYPEYMVLKKINMFNFIDRVESIAVLQWIFGLFIYVSVVSYYISKTIKNKNRGKILPAIIPIIMLLVSMKVFDYHVLYLDILYKIMPFFRILTLFIFILLSLIALKKTSNK